MTQKAVQEEINRIVNIIVSRFHPERVILFGSSAKGEVGPDSDIDLMVVMPVKGSIRKKANEIDDSLSHRTVPLDLIVVTPEQFERNSRRIGTVIRTAFFNGKVVYEHAA